MTIKVIKNTQGVSVNAYRVYQENLYGKFMPISGWLTFAEAVALAEAAKKATIWAVRIQSADNAEEAAFIAHVVEK